MILTNKFNLPDAYFRAVANDPYNSGGSDFTPSSLDQPPKAYALLKAFGDVAYVDIANRCDAIIGSGAHYVAERAARPGLDLCEERLFSDITIDGKKYILSAALDLYETDNCHLMDWKTTKAYAFSKKAGGGKKDAWEAQLNIGAELLRRHGHSPKKITIIALLKDWSPREAGTASCPEQQVIAVEMPIWSSEQVVTYVETKARLLLSASTETVCSPKDNWSGRRCDRWCDAQSICKQYQNSLKTGLLNS